MLEILDRDECLRLLASVPVGRIVFTHRALPAVQPVSFVVDGEAIVIRTAPGSELFGATRDTVVAFEADEIDADTHSGWNVTVIGHAHAVHDSAEKKILSALPLRPWTRRGQRDDFLRIPLGLVTGRRLLAGNPIHRDNLLPQAASE